MTQSIDVLKKLGMTVGSGRQETAAGHIDFVGFGFRRGVDQNTQAVITRLMHSLQFRDGDNETVAARLPKFVADAAAAMQQARAKGDRAGFNAAWDALISELFS